MKMKRSLLAFGVALILLCAVTSGIAQENLEDFMLGFEPEYGDRDYVLDTTNPYVKPIRQLQTTESGVVLLLDKVLVTEDEIAVTILLGVDPENEDWTPPTSFQLGYAGMEVTPHLPYPPGYFGIIHGGGGGGGSILNKIHGDPFVVYDCISSGLMFDDGYVSPKDPMHVKVKILDYEVCWNMEVSDMNYGPSCYHEQGPWEFEFDTDGAELAAKTKEFEVGEALDIEGKDVLLDRFRFNPMHLIAFTSGAGVDYLHGTHLSELTAFVETDDGTTIHLWFHRSPYIGFDRKIIDDAVIQSLEETKSLKVLFCLDRINGDYPQDYDPEKIEFYTCDPAWSTVIDLE